MTIWSNGVLGQPGVAPPRSPRFSSELLKPVRLFEAMEKRGTTDETRRSLEEILELCLNTAKRLRAVLERCAQPERATSRMELNGSTPDEGVEPVPEVFEGDNREVIPAGLR